MFTTELSESDRRDETSIEECRMRDRRDRGSPAVIVNIRVSEEEAKLLWQLLDGIESTCENEQVNALCNKVQSQIREQVDFSQK